MGENIFLFILLVGESHKCISRADKKSVEKLRSLQTRDLLIFTEKFVTTHWRVRRNWNQNSDNLISPAVFYFAPGDKTTFCSINIWKEVDKNVFSGVVLSEHLYTALVRILIFKYHSWSEQLLKYATSRHYQDLQLTLIFFLEVKMTSPSPLTFLLKWDI